MSSGEQPLGKRETATACSFEWTFQSTLESTIDDDHEPSSIDLRDLLKEQLLQVSPDLVRDMLQRFISTLSFAEADAVCGAESGTCDAVRSIRGDGCRHRGFVPREGTIDVVLPQLPQGCCFIDWLLERCQRAEPALTSVVAT